MPTKTARPAKILHRRSARADYGWMAAEFNRQAERDAEELLLAANF